MHGQIVYRHLQNDVSTLPLRCVLMKMWGKKKKSLNASFPVQSIINLAEQKY